MMIRERKRKRKRKRKMKRKGKKKRRRRERRMSNERVLEWSAVAAFGEISLGTFGQRSITDYSFGVSSLFSPSAFFSAAVYKIIIIIMIISKERLYDTEEKIIENTRSVWI
ncbi:hypothetical protein TWF481_011192 [Arthrobotrys musiformis]|uniref:Uncharacterized protein n=1 Tax=Arthrobotrys musiformis TaxID=47236 RepID=A0AAV9VXK8_9PEZI